MTRPKWKHDLFLGTIRAAGGEWVNRTDLAKAMGKRILSCSDVNQLYALRCEGLIEVEQRHRNKQQAHSLFYRAILGK